MLGVRKTIALDPVESKVAQANYRQIIGLEKIGAVKWLD
jgi:hypothetical protein